MKNPYAKLTAAFLALAIVIPLILLLFTSPAAGGRPHQLPIGVVAPEAAVTQVTAELDRNQPGGFEVHPYASADELIAATEDREVYGGIVLGPQPQAITATGASPIVATLITTIANTAAQGMTPPGAAAPTVAVTDVVPPAADDPRGAGFGSMVLPVFLTGMALAIASAFIARRPAVIAAALPIGAAVVGAAAVGVSMWSGVLPGNFVPQWLALSAGILAIATVVGGLFSLIRERGIGVAVLLFMLIGMPLAGVAAPPEFLPPVWATLGQSLPIGATGTALRSAAFFAPDSIIGTGAGTAFAVLVGWIVVGYGLLLTAAMRSRAASAATEAGEAEENGLPRPATI